MRYIGESPTTFGERYKEHSKDHSPIFAHQITTGHIKAVDNFKSIGRERTIWLEPEKKLYL